MRQIHASNNLSAGEKKKEIDELQGMINELQSVLMRRHKELTLT